MQVYNLQHKLNYYQISHHVFSNQDFLLFDRMVVTTSQFNHFDLVLDKLTGHCLIECDHLIHQHRFNFLNFEDSI